METSICRWCGKEFPIKWKRNPNVLCSLECKHKETAERQREVALRDNPIYKKGVVEKIVRTRRKNGSYLSGEKHPRWKGGCWFQYGYKVIENLKDTNGNKKFEHRKVMEEFIGRKLESNEVIHHINGNRQDNRIENLKIMTPSEHSKIHWELGYFNKRINKIK